MAIRYKGLPNPVSNRKNKLWSPAAPDEPALASPGVARQQREKARDNRRRIARGDKRLREGLPVQSDSERAVERTGIVTPRLAPGNNSQPKKKAVKRPKKTSAPSPQAAPRLARGGSSAPSGSGGGGSATPGGGSAPRATGGGSTGGKKKTIKVPVPGTTDPAAAVPEENGVDALMQPGFDELSRLESEAERTRGLQVTDAEALRNWMSGQNTAAEDFLSRSLAASRVAMPQNNMLAEAQRRAAEAVGGNADLMKASGVDAANATQAAYQQADAARGMTPELQAQVFSRGLADQRGVTSASMSNILGGIDSNFNNRLSELANKRVDLTNEGAKLNLQDQQAKATAAQDAKMFDLIAKEKLGKLAVDKTNAVTKRMQVISTAKNASRALDLKAKIEAGKLSRQEARDTFDQEMKREGLAISKRKLELARFDNETKRIKTTGANVAKLSDFVQTRYDGYLDQFGGVPWDQVDRGQQRKIVRNLIVGMRGAGGANLKQDEALAILAGVLGDIPVRDPAFKQMVTALWPR